MYVVAAGVMAFVGMAYFLLSLYQAATYYPDGYEWNRHFVSDLGRVTTETGKPNEYSASLFRQGTIVLAGCILPFFLLAPQQLPRFRPFVIAAGILSSLGLVGIALTPYDQYCDLHNVALGLWIVPMLLTMIALAMDWVDQGRSTTVILLITGLVFLTTLIYLAGFTRSGHVIFQKVVILSAMFWFLLVSISISFTITISISSRNQLAEEQAINYMNRLKLGHRK